MSGFDALGQLLCFILYPEVGFILRSEFNMQDIAFLTQKWMSYLELHVLIKIWFSLQKVVFHI